MQRSFLKLGRYFFVVSPKSCLRRHGTLSRTFSSRSLSPLPPSQRRCTPSLLLCSPQHPSLQLLLCHLPNSPASFHPRSCCPTRLRTTLPSGTFVSIALHNQIEVKLTSIIATENGIMGACGLYSQDMQLVVGLPLEYYNLTGIISPYCGSYVVVTNPLNNETVTARVADASATNETLSMSVGAWRAVKGDETQMSEYPFFLLLLNVENWIRLISHTLFVGNVTWIFANETQVDAAVAALPLVDLTVPAVTAASTSSSSSLTIECRTESDINRSYSCNEWLCT